VVGRARGTGLDMGKVTATVAVAFALTIMLALRLRSDAHESARLSIHDRHLSAPTMSVIKSRSQHVQNVQLTTRTRPADYAAPKADEAVTPRARTARPKPRRVVVLRCS
jgi:hypothetical protein